MKVYVVAYKSDGQIGHSWFYKLADADAALRVEAHNVVELADENWEAFHFEFDTRNARIKKFVKGSKVDAECLTAYLHQNIDALIAQPGIVHIGPHNPPKPSAFPTVISVLLKALGGVDDPRVNYVTKEGDTIILTLDDGDCKRVFVIGESKAVNAITITETDGPNDILSWGC